MAKKQLWKTAPTIGSVAARTPSRCNRPERHRLSKSSKKYMSLKPISRDFSRETCQSRELENRAQLPARFEHLMIARSRKRARRSGPSHAAGGLQSREGRRSAAFPSALPNRASRSKSRSSTRPAAVRRHPLSAKLPMPAGASVTIDGSSHSDAVNHVSNEAALR